MGYASATRPRSQVTRCIVARNGTDEISRKYEYERGRSFALSLIHVRAFVSLADSSRLLAQIRVDFVLMP